MLLFVGVAEFLVAGVALAKSNSCPGSGRRIGTPHNDRMHGGSGPDNVNGRRGLDVVNGGEDDVKVKGG